MIVSLRPPLEGIANERFLALAKELKRNQRNRNPIDYENICKSEIQWCRTHPHLGEYREIYEAAARLLIDLTRLSWEIYENGLGIELHSPRFPHRKGLSRQEIKDAKQRVQRELEPLRNGQFQNDSVREFIRKLEQPHPSTGRESIACLIADGAEVHSRIQKTLDFTDDDRQEKLAEVIKPYLQLVESKSKDKFTGIPLGDIWRYFRYTWRIPQTSIPGRQLLYLVRDAAHPFHAVMGIASLNNSALQLTSRDNLVGWTVESYKSRIKNILKADNTNKNLISEYHWLMENLELGLDAIDSTDLITKRELANPSEEIVARLRRRSEEFAALRAEVLKELAQTGKEQPGLIQETEVGDLSLPPVDDGFLNLEGKKFTSQQAKGHRITIAKKRAFEFARLLQAKLILKKNKEHFQNPSMVENLFAIEDFHAAINTVFSSIKSVRIGTNMLEITTCGAIPPYNHLLAGKLVSLLMISPQIFSDYQRRYGNEPSIISSQLKNDEVIRSSTLVYLGTTSLYAYGSSQYERLKLPEKTIASDQPEIRFQRIGETTGYGTVQFSPETVRSIEAVLHKVKGFKHVNSIFGEGHSPRLRKLTAGLAELGFPSEGLLKHNQKRLVYGIQLFNGTKDFLCGRIDEVPDYLCNPKLYVDASKKIIEFWRRRWLGSRLNYEPALVSLMLSKPWKLSEKIPVSPYDTQHKNSTSGEDTNDFSNPSNPNKDIEFWQKLAMAGSNVTSDELTNEELERLHVALPLESFIVDKVKEGFSIVLTGNAGDGKTHLLRRLEKELQEIGAVVEPDATAAMRKGHVTPIINSWRKAVSAGKPFCLAANEYPLYQIRIKGKGSLPLLDEVDRQCRGRLLYSDSSVSSEIKDKVLVIDLSLRNPLASEFAGAMIDKMLSDGALRSHAEAKIDPVFTRNFERLSEPFVKERLLSLFERLLMRGHRSTIRELWIILARLFFGGSEDSNKDQSIKSWYSSRLFEVDSRFLITQLLKEHCDPGQFSHPQWDLFLERQDRDSFENWKFRLPQLPIQPEIDEQSFTALKRAFYFEHQDGNQVFDLEAPYALNFQKILKNAGRGDSLEKEKLVAAINTCYCPIDFHGSRDGLMLWIGHRFHEQPTKSYVACQRIPSSDLTLNLPKLPSYLKDHLVYTPDHFELRYTKKKQSASLLIDFSLYATLSKLNYGLPRKLLPEKDINRLDLFIEKLHSMRVDRSRQFICFNVEQYDAARIRLSNDNKVYEIVEKYGY